MNSAVINLTMSIYKMEKRTEAIFAFLCIGIVCAVAMPVIIGEYDNSFLTVNTTSQITTLGSNATYLLTITNTGNETDTFNLSTINIDDASVAVLNPFVIILDAEQSGNITLNVTDDFIIGPYCVLVNVTSQTSGLTDEVETITAVVEEWEE